jgi:hypothetical protein
MKRYKTSLNEMFAIHKNKFITDFFVLYATCDAREKGQLLEIHLLEKTARHQNLDSSTLFEQMSKKWKLLENQKRVISSRFKFLTKMINCSNCNCSTKSLEHVRQFGYKTE